MKKERKEIFLEAMRKSKELGLSAKSTGSYLWSLYQSPFMNKRSLTEATELYRRGTVPESIFRQLDLVAKKEIEKRRKNIEKKNRRLLVPKILWDASKDPDFFD